MKNALDIFKGHQRQARIWFWLFLLTITGFSVERWHLVNRLNADTKVIVIDENTIYLSKVLDFSEARKMHEQQAVLAVETLFNRHPGGADHPERMKKLFTKQAYQQAMALIELETPVFETRQIHQKIEVSRTEILQSADNSVVISVNGQLLRVGTFDGKPHNEGLRFKVHLTFVRNPSMATNGAFPTLVGSMAIETEPIR